MDAVNSIILGEDTGGKGRVFQSRFLQAGLVKYSFGVCLLTKETINKFVNSFIGCPVRINHKDITDENAKDERVGVVSDVWFNDNDGWFWCKGVIFDDKAIELINNGYTVSCQYEITEYSDNIENKLHNGIPYDKEILNGKFEHLAIVDNPRYEGALIAVNALMASNDKWITIKPNGEENTGKHLLLKKGESPYDAIRRVYGDRNQKQLFDTSQYKKHKEDYKREREEEERRGQEAQEKHRQVVEKHKEKRKQKYNEIKEKYINDEIADGEIIKTLGKEGFDISFNDLFDWGDEREKRRKEKVKEDKQNKQSKEYVKRDNNKISAYKKDLLDKYKSLGDKEKQEYLKYVDKQAEKFDKDINYKEAADWLHKYDEADIFGKPVSKEDIKEYKSERKYTAYLYKNKDDDTYAEEKTFDSQEKAEEYIKKNKDKYEAYDLHSKSKDEEKAKQEHAGKTAGLDKLKSTFEKSGGRKERKATNEYKPILDYIENYDERNDEMNEETKNVFERLISALKAKNEADEKDKKAENEEVDKRDIIRQIMAIAGKEEASEDVKTIAKLAEKLAYDKSEAGTADNKAKNEDDKEKEKADNCRAKNDKVDKRELIDQVGGILKGKVDDEIIRTVIGKLEEIAYDKSEAGTADNKAKNDDDEYKKLKDDVEKDVENCKAKNSMDALKDLFFEGEVKQAKTYMSQKERIELGKQLF